jgi:hypothetical protein
MASDGSNRSGLLTAAGVLSIVAGALEVIFGGIAAVSVTILSLLFGGALLPFNPGPWFDPVAALAPFWSVIVGAPVFALGLIAIVGGVFAIRRRSFGVSLAGAICALPSGILGILAIIFVCLSRKEFRAES